MALAFIFSRNAAILAMRSVEGTGAPLSMGEVWGGARMEQKKHFTAIIEREGDDYLALCPEIDVASQGDTVEDASRNLTEAIELFLEVADPSEVQDRLHTEVFVTRLDLPVG
jgi:predicted RNase H-like HicB family nuclease